MKLLQPIVQAAGAAAEKFFENKGKVAEFQAEFYRNIVELVTSNEEARKAVLLGEIQGESWLQRNWRPVLMLSIVGIVINNHLFAPYVMLIAGVDVVVDLPERMWDLMLLGVGGYIPARSLEKAVSVWAETKKQKKTNDSD